MKTFLVEETSILESGNKVFPNIKVQAIVYSTDVTTYRSEPIETLEKAEEWANFRVRVTMQEDHTRQEVRIVEYEFDDETGEFKSAITRNQWYAPLTREEIIDKIDELEAVLIGDEWYYVLGHYSDLETEFDDGEDFITLGTLDDGFMHEDDWKISELTNRYDVKLFICSQVGKTR